MSKGEQAPGESETVFRQAIQVRETIFQVFASLTQNESLRDDELVKLHQVWLENQSHSKLKPTESGFVLGWEEGDALDSMFLDKSRNQKRRWCSMSACGNRVKMARRYEREKQGT